MIFNILSNLLSIESSESLDFFFVYFKCFMHSLRLFFSNFNISKYFGKTNFTSLSKSNFSVKSAIRYVYRFVWEFNLCLGVLLPMVLVCLCLIIILHSHLKQLAFSSDTRPSYNRHIKLTTLLIYISKNKIFLSMPLTCA